MAKKSKVKKTLVDQILDKAKIDHDSLSFNGLEGELPEDVARESIYKTLALREIRKGLSSALSLSPNTCLKRN